MSRTVLAALLLLTLPHAALAQGETPPSAPAQQDPAAAYDELVKAFNKAVSDWQTAAQAAVEKAQAEGGRMPAIAMQPPTKEFIGRAQELAAEHAGKDAAVPFLGFILKYASNERAAVKKAISTLAADHAASKAIGDVLPFAGNAMRFGAREQVAALLDAVADGHPDADTKAQGLIARGGMRLQTARTDEQRKAAEADLRAVATTTKNEEILAQAKDALFEIENLQVGCKSPEIEGVDTDGVPFKLSDYRGKVVLLDFWGFW
ncbi:MAG: hypothetical protein INH34_14575 [Phycisphaerales bacterium]|jgi:hypothetical protein|nr:hypothetical protein [Phycisphaerales bacterium]